MAKFVPRLVAPSKSDKHYYSTDNIFYACGYGMPNCTAYAWGRLYELTGKRYTGLTGNAEDFMASALRIGLKTGKEPKLGAIICWRAGEAGNSSDGAGHVGVVEQIKDNGDIVVSASAWKGEEFYLTTLTKSSGYVYSPLRPLQGFIYCGIEFDGKNNNEVKPGLAVYLEAVQVFNSETALSAYGTRSGKFYLWDGTIRNGRIRVTNAVNKVGIPGKVSFWVNLADIGLVADTADKKSFKAETKYVLSNAVVYNSEGGSSIGRRSGIYYTWDDTIRNGRIRMTNSPARVGVPGCVSFWVDVSSLS